MQRIILFVMIIIITAVNVIAQTYNHEKAAEYASFWCDKRNTWDSPYFDKEKWGGPYVDYGPYGGDCAAFVSQSLIYGGLDLSKGTDGNGNGVKPDKVISGATNLVLHLGSHQIVDKVVLNSFNPPANHDVGDPVFVGESAVSAHHSLFCSSLDWDAKRLYCTHTNDYCEEDFSKWNFFSYKLIFFHIKSAYPDHCFDCEPNNGEQGIDCGEPCPPCDHAPDRVIINTPTNNLPSVVSAIEEVRVGDAAIKVLSGQDVTFITAGSINLLPGFEVDAGGNFNATPKGNILSITADCNDFCWPDTYFYWWRIPYFYIDNLAGADRIYYEIYTPNYWNTKWVFVHSDDIYVDSDGRVNLWDMQTGENISGHFEPPGAVHEYCIYMYFYSCHDPENWWYGVWVRFWVTNPSKSKNKSSYSDSEFDETENPPSFLTPPPNNITFQDESTSPHFSIIPNPNAGTFQLETNFPITAIETLKITNMLGVPVFESQSITSNTIQLPASASGQHVVVLSLKDGTVLSQKMMLQR